MMPFAKLKKNAEDDPFKAGLDMQAFKTN